MNNSHLLFKYSGLDIPINDTVYEDVRFFLDEKVMPFVGIISGSSIHPIDLASMHFYCKCIEGEGQELQNYLLHLKEAMPYWTSLYNNTFLPGTPKAYYKLKKLILSFNKYLNRSLGKVGLSYSFPGGLDLSGLLRCMIEQSEGMLEHIRKGHEEDKKIANSPQLCLEQKKKHDRLLEDSDYYKVYIEQFNNNVTMFTTKPQLEEYLKKFESQVQATATWGIVSKDGAIAGGDERVAQRLRHSVSPDDYNKYYVNLACETRVANLIKEKFDNKSKKVKGWLKDDYDNDDFKTWLKGAYKKAMEKHGELTYAQYAFVFYRECYNRGYAHDWKSMNVSAFINDMSDSASDIKSTFYPIISCFKGLDSLEECPNGDDLGRQKTGIEKIFTNDIAMSKLKKAIDTSLSTAKTAQA